MDRRARTNEQRKKKRRPIDREFNTALYLKNALGLGLRVDDLKYISVGMVYDLVTEKLNDEYEYNYLATQDDFNKMAGIK